VQEETLKEESEMNRSVIAIDLAKSVFEIGVSEEAGEVSERKRLSRKRLVEWMSQRQPSVIVMEACGSAHAWGRTFMSWGHEVKLLPPHTVRAYVPRNKTDRTDTKGLLEAHRNRGIHPVPVRTLERQTLATLHRVRSGWLKERVARSNALRGHLRELGYPIPQGAEHVVPRVRELVADVDSAIPIPLRDVFFGLCQEIELLEEKIRGIERQLRAVGKQDGVVKELLGIPGIGILNATALVAFIGDASRFPSSRHLASYLGLTPREHSSGAKRWLGRISKQGNRYLRQLLVHGARAVLAAVKRRGGSRSQLESWAIRIRDHRGHNKATVALANKLARIVWAVWTKNQPYRPHPTTT
jgi:transposase